MRWLALCLGLLLTAGAWGQEGSAVVARLRERAEEVRGTPRELPVLLNLYKSERFAGNFLRAARVRERLLEHPDATPFIRLSVHFLDAGFLAQNADPRGAREQWEQGAALLARMEAEGTQRLYLPRARARQEAVLAAILRVEGRSDEAGQVLDRALAANARDIRLFREGAGSSRPNAGRELATAEDDRANLLSEQITLRIATGRIGAAELVALEWLQAARDGRAKQLTSALKRHGDVLMAAGRFSRALARFDEALARQREAGLDATSVPMIRTRRSRAQALMGQGRWEDAFEEFRDVEMTIRGNPLANRILLAGPDRALARAMTGRLVEAEHSIDNALASNRRNFGPDHPTTVASEGLRALVLTRFKRDEAALPQFRRYLDGWGYSLAGADPAQEESALVQLRHRLILEHYLAVLARRADGDAAALGEAFRVADALRAGHVQQAVTAAAARANIGDTALAALLREDQDLGHAAAALYRALGEGGKNGAEARENAPVPLEAGARLREIEARRAALQAELRQRFPDYQQLVRPMPPLPAEIAALLRPGEALVSIAATADASYVFAVAADGRAQLHVAPLGERWLAERVRRLRMALDVGDTPLERLPPFDVAAAHELYRELLLPLEPLWSEAKHLIVSSGGSLAQIPFGLLAERPELPPPQGRPFAEYAQVPWLARRLAVSHVPSAAALAALRKLRPLTNGRRPFVGFGDPDFGGAAQASPGRLRSVRRNAEAQGEPAASLLAAFRALAPLPDTREEILTLARTLGAAQDATYLGAAASRVNALSPALGKHTVVAFSTHGLLPGDLPGLDQPALALALTKESAEPPLLTLSDVLGLKLDADWVVLSACNTAGAEGEAAEALSGLGRGFFFAGARAILVTHWPVESESARKLVSATFARFAADRQMTRAEALRAAQLELMAGGGSGFSYAHPLFWAPYALIGDGGR